MCCWNSVKVVSSRNDTKNFKEATTCRFHRSHVSYIPVLYFRFSSWLLQDMQTKQGKENRGEKKKKKKIKKRKRTNDKLLSSLSEPSHSSKYFSTIIVPFYIYKHAQKHDISNVTVTYTKKKKNVKYLEKLTCSDCDSPKGLVGWYCGLLLVAWDIGLLCTLDDRNKANIIKKPIARLVFAIYKA